MLRFESNSPKDTFCFGKALGGRLETGDIVCLYGGLGAGKTNLTKGICQGLEVEDEITSPTYTIVNQYQGKKRVNHLDLYRVDNEEELYQLGFEEYLYQGAVVIIEWPARAERLLPDDVLNLYLEGKENYREIRIEDNIDKYSKLIMGLREDVNFRD